MPERPRQHPLREHARGVGYVVLAAGVVLLSALAVVTVFAWALT